MGVKLLFGLGRVVSPESQHGGGAVLGLCSWRIRVGFVVDEVALGQVFLPVLRFFPVSIITPSLPTHLNITVRRTSGTKSGNLQI